MFRTGYANHQFITSLKNSNLIKTYSASIYFFSKGLNKFNTLDYITTITIYWRKNEIKKFHNIFNHCLLLPSKKLQIESIFLNLHLLKIATSLQSPTFALFFICRIAYLLYVFVMLLKRTKLERILKKTCKYRYC